MTIYFLLSKINYILFTFSPLVVSEACMDLVVDETKNGAVMQIWGENNKVFIEYPKLRPQ